MMQLPAIMIRLWCGMCAVLFIAAAEASTDTPVELLGDPTTSVLRSNPSTATTTLHDGVRSIDVLTAGKWHDVQLAIKPTQGWSVGDTLVLNVELRATEAAEESGEGWVLLALQQSVTPHAKAFRFERSVPRQWTTLQYPFKATSQVNPAESEVILGMGNRKQRIDIRRISLTNHGSTPVASLPMTEATYAGREPTAAWRAEAHRRIDRYRKADLSIRVMDAAGRPVPDAVVKIEQTRHAFGFGSAVAADLLLGDSDDAKRYRQVVERDFSRVVLENDLKWGPWIQKRQLALDALQWLRDRDIQVRGHVLVWPSYKQMYESQPYAGDPAQLARHINDHIVDEVSAVGRLVNHWDVINEPYTNHDAMDVLGNEAMVEWFNLARQTNPHAQLYINDFAILSGGGADIDHQNHYERTIRYLIEQGAPLDGIGFQGHFSSTLTSPQKVWSLLERYAAFGKKLHITEFDVDTDSPQLQADYTRDFMTICFSHPQMDGFVMWGFWEGRHWKPRAAIYNKNWSLRPAGYVWRDLVFNQWWTRLRLRTDADGMTTSRVFRGDYTIAVGSTLGDATRVVAVGGDEPTEVRITLDPRQKP